MPIFLGAVQNHLDSSYLNNYILKNQLTNQLTVYVNSIFLITRRVEMRLVINLILQELRAAEGYFLNEPSCCYPSRSGQALKLLMYWKKVLSSKSKFK